MAWPGSHSASDEQMQAVDALLNRRRSMSDCTWYRQIDRISADDCAAYAKESPENGKIASRWVPQDLTEVQRWVRYDAARTYLEHYDRDGDSFLRLGIALDDTGPDRTNLILAPIQWMSCVIMVGHHANKKKQLVIPLLLLKYGDSCVPVIASF